MGSLHQSLVEKNSCWSLRTSTPDNLNWQPDIRAISSQRGSLQLHFSTFHICKFFKQSIFLPWRWIRKNKKKKESFKKTILTILLVCLLTVNLPQFADAFSQSMISAKPCIDLALDNSRNASRHPWWVKTWHCLYPSHLQKILFATSVKVWTLLCADSNGTEQEARELLHPPHETEENCKKLE